MLVVHKRYIYIVYYHDIIMKYKQLWIRLRDYRRIRKNFKANYGETLVNYFERLANELQKSKGVLLFEDKGLER